MDANSLISSGRSMLSSGKSMFITVVTNLGLFGVVVLAGGTLLLVTAVAHEQSRPFLDALVDPHTLLLVTKDLGIALIVAAIAVIGYELARHAAGIVELSQLLRTEIDAWRQAGENSNAAIERHVEQLLPDHEHAEFRNALSRLIRMAAQIRQHSRGGSEPARGIEYVRYLGWLVEQFPTQSAQKLLDLVGGLETQGVGTLYLYKPPERRDVARQILAAQMRCMGQGGHYASVASLATYDSPTASALKDATRNALHAGMRMRRIFNIAPLEDELRDPQRFRHWQAVVRQLRAVFDELGEVRFIGRATAACLDPNRLGDAQLPTGADALARLFFGIFTHRKGDAVLFDATSSDVDVLRLAYCGNVLAGQSDNGYLSLFEHLWALMDGAPDPFDADVFDPRWLDGHCSDIVQGRRPLPSQAR